MRTFTILLASCLLLHAHSQSLPALIPKPVSMTAGTAPFKLNSTIVITVPDNKEIISIATRFAAQLKTSFNIKTTLQPLSPPRNNAINFVIAPTKFTNKEAYSLISNASSITLSAAQPSGIFYGLQTLLQLFPTTIASTSSTSLASLLSSSVASSVSTLTSAISIPAVTINDSPRFAWRGLMLDVSRHFFTKEEVKRFIDDMVKYKFNTLHWHLTDDQGWRIEIKSLPKLTSVGAWRVPKTGRFGTFDAPATDEAKTYGGFYTQDDIREIVKYASERYVNILPEVDVPGHSLAAIAAYPELTCTPGTYNVNSGEQFMVWPSGGQHFYGLLDNSLCPANEKVYEFMDKVFTEVAQLFPFTYIHMGGDETARNFWEKSDAVKGLMQKEKLKDLDEVQSYFVKRMEKIIESKGKKMIGWDEILQGGLAPNAAVMSWRGTQFGVEAAKQGHDVVMAPTDFVYLDYMQADVSLEPQVYASLRMKKTYEFEPVPDNVDASRILGGQGNLWTEQVYNIRQVQYMIWPRALALSEVLWSPKSKRNYGEFITRVEKHFDRLDASKTKYARAIYDPEVKVTKLDSTGLSLTLTPEIEGLSMHYSFDNSTPDEFYPAYSSSIKVPMEATQLKVISYRNGKPVGRLMAIPVADLRKRAGYSK